MFKWEKSIFMAEDMQSSYSKIRMYIKQKGPVELKYSYFWKSKHKTNILLF